MNNRVEQGSISLIEQNYVELLYFSASDNPNMVIGNIIFNGLNYLSWSHSIRLGLGAKMKLGFIGRSLPKPSSTSLNYVKWERNDYMVCL